MAKRSTKQQLLLSAISLLLCISMLVGSTFAWFTDTVTSTNNIIKSGTLDVELYYQAEGQTDWTKVTSETNIFKDGALWEPGYTEVVKLKVVNEGTLALKYKLGVNVAKETPGTLEDESTFMLSDYIKFGIIEGAQTYTRDQAIAAVKDTATPLNKAYTSEVTKLLPKDAANTDNEDIVTMVVYMPTSVGNEANYRGTQPIINLGLNLLATQLEYEEDSFDENYDKDSVYAEHFVTTVDELTAAIAEGGVIALMNDLELAVNGKAISVPADKSVTLNLNGNDIIGTTNVTGASQVLFEVNGELTVEGDGTLALYDQSGAAFNNAYENVVVYVNGGVANLNGGSIVCTSDGQAMAYAADAVGGNSVINVNGATLYSSYIGIRSFPTASGKTNTINYNSGDVYGAKNGYDIWTQTGSGSSVVNIADGINYTREDQWGGMYYVNDNKAYAVTATELSTALAADGDVVLASDVTFTGIASMPDRSGYVEAYGNKVGFAQYSGVIDGNGHEIVDEDGDDSYVIVTHGGTIKNLTITTGARGIVTYSPTENVYLDNIVVDGPGYALNSTEYGYVDMVVTNSTINGWTSLAGFKSVSFEKCKLGENSAKYWQGFGYDQDYDRLFRVYSPTTFTNCEFEQGYYLDMSAGGTATVKNCTVNGVVINAENYADYITVEIPSGKILSDCVTFA